MIQNTKTITKYEKLKDNKKNKKQIDTTRGNVSKPKICQINDPQIFSLR